VSFLHPAGRALSVLAVGLAVAACGSSSAPSPAPGSAVALVAGSRITAAQLDVRLQSAIADIVQAGGPANNPQMLTSLTATVIGSLIFDTVVAQEAVRLHMAASQSQVDDRVRQFTQDAGGASQLQSQLAAAGQSMAGLRDEITAEIDEQAVESYFARLRALQVIQQLAQGTAFDSLVTQYSDSPDTSSKRGELGTLTAAQIAAELGANALSAIRSLQAGQYTTTPIRNTQGYEIIRVDAVTATAWTLREILIAAPQPYTVKERPEWFSEEVYYQIFQDCQAGKITLYGRYARVTGANPCTGGSPTPSPAAASASP
jgi:hypothetical protein